MISGTPNQPTVPFLLARWRSVSLCPFMSFHVFCSSLRTQLTVLDIRVIVLLANFIGLVRVSFIFLQIPGFQISSRAYALAPGLHGTAWHGAVSLEKDEVMFCLYWQERRLKNPIIHYHTIYIYVYIYLYTAPRNIGNELFIVHPNYELWHPKKHVESCKLAPCFFLWFMYDSLKFISVTHQP